MGREPIWSWSESQSGHGARANLVMDREPSLVMDREPVWSWIESQPGHGAGFFFNHLQRANECLAGKESLLLSWVGSLVLSWVESQSGLRSRASLVMERVSFLNISSA